MRKPAFCICENKDADQLPGNREADQCLCFRYMDSTIPLLSKSKISSLWPSSVVVQPGLCRTRSETLMFPPAPKKGMVKFSRKGHFQRASTCKEGTFERAATCKEGTFKLASLTFLQSYLLLPFFPNSPTLYKYVF